MYSAKPIDWLGMVALVIMFGSAFMFTKISVQEYPPTIVAAGRIIIAAILLIIFSIIRKDSFAFVKNHWILLIALAFFGNCLPFYLISWGQQTVDSSIAGILMAVMPLTTIALAHFFVPSEPLTANRIIGFLLGFVGIVVLFGPRAWVNFEGDVNWLLAMFAILAGAISYAVNTIIAKRLPNESLVAMSAAVLVVASFIMLPAILITNQDWAFSVNSIAFASIILLGIFPTALATVIYFSIIARVGPSFLSQINYLIPIWAVIIGILFLNEKIGVNALIALMIILFGIAIAQSKKLSFARF